jgi:hypothetical protein
VVHLAAFRAPARVLDDVHTIHPTGYDSIPGLPVNSKTDRITRGKSLDDMQGRWDCGLEKVGRDCKLRLRMSKSRKEPGHDSHDPT